MLSKYRSNLLKSPALALVAVLIPGVALAGLALGEKVGTSEQEIRAYLEEKGYTIEEFEMEDGMIEVEYSDAGVELEIAVNPETGEIVEMEKED